MLGLTVGVAVVGLRVGEGVVGELVPNCVVVVVVVVVVAASVAATVVVGSVAEGSELVESWTCEEERK